MINLPLWLEARMALKIFPVINMGSWYREECEVCVRWLCHGTLTSCLFSLCYAKLIMYAWIFKVACYIKKKVDKIFCEELQ